MSFYYTQSCIRNSSFMVFWSLALFLQVLRPRVILPQNFPFVFWILGGGSKNVHSFGGFTRPSQKSLKKCLVGKFVRASLGVFWPKMPPKNALFSVPGAGGPGRRRGGDVGGAHPTPLNHLCLRMKKLTISGHFSGTKMEKYQIARTCAPSQYISNCLDLWSLQWRLKIRVLRSKAKMRMDLDLKVCRYFVLCKDAFTSRPHSGYGIGFFKDL